MTEDVVRALGFLCLGTRLKRIGERLQADSQRLMIELGMDVPSALHPFLAALDRLGPLTVGELAEAVGITQPGATRSIAQLVDTGLAQAEASPEDQRRKVIRLTAAGETLVAVAKADVWPGIEHAVADLCATLDGPFLDQLAALEDGLSERPLGRRLPPHSNRARIP